MVNSAQLDALISRMMEEYIARNAAARTLRGMLDEAGIGFWPVMDHLTIRTENIDKRAEEFLNLGYVYSETLEFEDWYAKVYRLAGYPAVFIDQAYEDERGETSVIGRWVQRFGHDVFHHIAVRVEDIDKSIAALELRGVRFVGEIVGERGGDLRQIFSAPEIVDGQSFSVLELAERHRGYQGFLPPQANSLMAASTLQP